VYVTKRRNRTGLLERQGKETEILKYGKDNGPEERSDCKKMGWGGTNMWWILQNDSCGVCKMSGSVYFVSENKSLNHCLLQFVVTGRISIVYRGADNFLAQPGRKQATVTEDFDFDISCL